MIIDIVSDLHGAKPKLEGGDLLILAGDYTRSDTNHEYSEFFEWLKVQKYRKKVLTSGNHDNAAMSQFDWDGDSDDTDYLYDTGTEFEGLKIWGSPWTAWFQGINPHCAAFTLKTDRLLAEKWALIPKDTDILITHSPPFGILDEVWSASMHMERWEHTGSKSLLGTVAKIYPKLHVFGHIHEAYGEYEWEGVRFINASMMDINYRPTNKPVRIEL